MGADAIAFTDAEGRRRAARPRRRRRAGPGSRRQPGAASRVPEVLGREVVLERPHGLAHPMLMDATVEQIDGFRFVYVLPLAADRLLVEDTYFADRPCLDGDRPARRASTRTSPARGWRVGVRRARGVAACSRCRGEMEPPAPTPPLVAGYQGGWFHPVTGYSFLLAVRLASFDRARGAAGDAVRRRARRAGPRAPPRSSASRCASTGCCSAGSRPSDRYHVLERFYRLPEPTIRRFYALELIRARPRPHPRGPAAARHVVASGRASSHWRP